MFDDAESFGIPAGFFLEMYDRVRVRDNRERTPIWRYGTISNVIELEGGGWGYEIKLDQKKNPVVTDGVNFSVEKHAPRKARKPKWDQVNKWKS